MSTTPSNLKDPRHAGPTPPFQEDQLTPPAQEFEMNLKPDHGEESYKGSGRLKGRTALITGGDSGIGRAVAIAFAREGADMVVSYLEEDEDAEETKRQVEASGQRCKVIRGDITDEEHCQMLVDTTVKEFGKLDILVNNAAFQMSYESLDEIPTEEFDRTFRTNIYAPFWLCKAAAKVMEAGSTIINTASINSYQPLPILLPYATTKGAIANFTKGLAQLLAKQGIRVNAVAPGPVWTPLIPSTMPKDAVKDFGKQTPLGRPAQPAELAPVYVLLASQESSYVTGMIYGVTGGEIMA
ncbi:MAG: SDR family oxidoreductase [Blastochloris viridis]|uniref:SDR family oxidoreductase n=1 Tax=Blastochloris viridis TaxID=1079 RepID=A0A6N4R7X8_BLAVI|nr:MAG: SDR family oxidoreductase [Blastochloris viridis]